MARPAVLPAMLPVVLPHDHVVDPAFAAVAERAWTTAAAKVERLTATHPDAFPLYTRDGAWVVDGEAWTSWCEGFLGGQLWLLSARAPDAADRRRFRVKAEHYSRLIEHRKTDTSVHDLGFLFWSTYRRWFELTGDPRLDDVLVTAGRTTASRFRPVGGYVPSFRRPDSVFIDIMMNIHLALYAAQRTGDEEPARAATQHCLTTRRHLVRGDGSTSHEAMFDLSTGAFLAQTTQQGFSDSGSWARGQAWALHGFGTVYRFTGDRRFLQTAQTTADFWLEQTRDQVIPPNDWAEPDPPRPWESSAAAAAAGGLWQLAGLVQDPARARAYADHAVRTLVALGQDEFLTTPDEPWEGVLKHGVYHEGKGLGVDESVMWGDYWFLDAVDAVQRHTESVTDPAGGPSRA